MHAANLPIAQGDALPLAMKRMNHFGFGLRG